MSLDAAELFVRVVQAGSFSGAARRLGMPKSTISLRVAELERRLGVTLLKRTTRKLQITEAGAIYLETASRALSELRATEGEIIAAQSEPKGTLRVACAMAMGEGTVGDLLTAFLRAYPAIELTFEVFERPVDLIAENFDAAFHVGALADTSALTARSLGTSCRQMLASPAYLEGRPPLTHPRDLDGHDLLLFAGQSEIAFLSDVGERFEARLSGRFSTNQLSALRSQAAAGLGIASLPAAFVADDLRRGVLTTALPGWRAHTDPIHLLYPRQKFLPRKVRAFVDFMVRAFPVGSCLDARCFSEATKNKGLALYASSETAERFVTDCP